MVQNSRVNLLVFLLLLASLPFDPHTVKLRRISTTPVLSPRGETWEAAGVFNPAVVRFRGKYVMLYRAQDAAGTSRLGYAESTDGIYLARHAEPVLSTEEDYERYGGVDDTLLLSVGD